MTDTNVTDLPEKRQFKLKPAFLKTIQTLFPSLTVQEVTVLYYLASGFDIPTIARLLRISDSTAKTYLLRTKKKLRLDSTIELKIAYSSRLNQLLITSKIKGANHV